MIPIFFGSQTGNSINLSKILSLSIEDSFYMDLQNFNILKINEIPFYIFIVSTHGDGQPPFNSSNFFTSISSLENKKLFNFKYCVLGLGDSCYLKYNKFSKDLINELKLKGAELVYYTFSNSQDKNGIYDGFNEFKNFLIDYIKINKNKLNNKNINKKYISQDTVLYKAKVIENEPFDNNLLNFKLILEIPNYDFYPGDVIGILPKNKISLKNVFKNFSDKELNYLKEKIDFSSLVKFTFFKDLHLYTKKDLYKKKLIEISKDYDLYYFYAVDNKKNVLDVISDFDLDLSYDFIIKNLDQINFRYFSCSKIKSFYKILYKMNFIKEEKEGLCSCYLKKLKKDFFIDVKIEKSKLFFDDKKLLFFSTGTGVTLPLSVISYFSDKEIIIYYGFRSYKEDFLISKEELKIIKEKKIKLFEVPSRDMKKYIMDIYKQNPVKNINEWLVFVSGNCRLNKEIYIMIKNIHNEEIIFQSETW